MNKTKELIAKYHSLFIFILVAGLLFSGYQVVFPRLLNIFEMNKEIQANQQRLNNLRTKITDLQRINETELSKNNDLALQAIPSKKNMISILSSLSTLANENAIIIDEISISSGSQVATASADQLGSFIFSLKLIGNTTQIRSFAGSINTVLPIFTLKDLNVDVLSGASVLRIQSYYMGFPMTIAKVDEPLVALNPVELETLKKIASSSSFLDTITEDSIGGGKINPFSQ